MLYRVYVDEAGDRGISSGSNRYFGVSAVIVADSDDAQLRAELERLRGTLGRHPGHVLHFVKFSHSQRLKAVQDIAAFSLASITNVVVDKELVRRPLPDGRTAYISRPGPMYLWALRLLLERIAWFVGDRGGTDAIVTFAHLKGFRSQTLHGYRKALEASGSASIQWEIFHEHPFRFASPREVELLQIADTTASALFRAVEPDRYGNTEYRYLQELTPKLYRRGDGDVTSYGLKAFPSDASKLGGSLAFLRDF